MGTSCEVTDEFVSYHTHVLFWNSNEEHKKGALELRDKFINEFGLGNNEHNCTINNHDAFPGHPMCVFPVEYEPSGPFLTSQYSFFIPADQF